MLIPSPLNRILFSLSICLFLTIGSVDAEEYSFLKADDRIVVIGDSITARGVFCSQIERVLNAVYPGNRISITNKAVGGQASRGGLETLRQYIDNGGAPTVALVMLAVNDLKMRPDHADEKEQEFLKWMRQFAPLARQHKIQLVFLAETPFSHNDKPAQFENQMNVVLDRLAAGLIRMAREQDVPVIDVHATYVRGLHEAWQKDPRYEFSPDVIHPLPTGEACISAAILDGMGVGLPLAKDGRRPPIRAGGPATVELTAADDVNLLPKDGKLTVRITARNLSDQPRSGTMVAVLDKTYDVGRVTLAPKESRRFTVSVPTKDFSATAGTQPLYLMLRAKDGFASGFALFHYAAILPAAPPGVSFNASQFRPLSATYKGKLPCPITRLSLERTSEAVSIRFHVNDPHKVCAQDHFDAYKISARARQRINAPIDLLSSPTWQACDAIEFFFDLRPHATAARDTSPEDGNPEGVVRLGMYYKEQEGQPKAALALPAGFDPKRASLQSDGDDTYTLKVALASLDSTLGFAVRVTDADEFKPEAGRVHYLVAEDPMMFGGKYYGPTGQRYGVLNFIRLGLHDGGFFYRVGY